MVYKEHGMDLSVYVYSYICIFTQIEFDVEYLFLDLVLMKHSIFPRAQPDERK